MNTKAINICTALLASAALVSCNNWLDVMPDNRAEVDTIEKVSRLLGSAYPDNSHILCAELWADNVDDHGNGNPYSSTFADSIYFFKDKVESNNEDPKSIWQAHYGAITNANQALQAIEDLGNPEEAKPYRGEALLSRAYNHFMLAQIFCAPYDPLTAASELGLPYMENPEIELNPKYERGNLFEYYECIRKDIEEGLPLISDAIYTVPKYHFNRNAAYTFASRFYLFTGEWDKVIECSNAVLGNAPSAMLRDVASLSAMARNFSNVALQYNSTDAKNNFMMHTGYSVMGLFMGPYYYMKRQSTTKYICATELYNRAPWGSYPVSSSNTTWSRFYKIIPYIYAATNLDCILVPKNSYLFEYSDPVAGIGYHRSLFVVLTAEEALLNRAEAYAAIDNYAACLEDLNLWTANTLNNTYCTNAGGSATLTEESIEKWANGMAYYTPMNPTPKRHLHSALLDLEEGSKKEAIIQAILYTRRVEFSQMGMRWLDIKRYGIPVYRRVLSSTSFEVAEVKDSLLVGDPRRVAQIPQDVVTAGFEPNPR